MQLYASDFNGQPISARQALKQTNYYCLECQQTVRLRGGPYRQPHFYHLEPTPFCRQHQKGQIHLQLQFYFLQHLPLEDCQLECSFPSIRRIADVVWLSQKIVFEIQCSPISGEEVLARNRDYQRLGWRVIWILHDQRYNQVRLSAAELALRSSPHFFTNMNEKGVGVIYDQFELCNQRLRLKRLPPLPIEITKIDSLDSMETESLPLLLLKQRVQAWNFSFTGDLFSLFLHSPSSHYLSQALEIEQSFYSPPQRRTCLQFLFHLWHLGIVNSYQILFRFLLERMCR